MPYIYRVSRRDKPKPATAGVVVPAAEPVAVEPEVSYRDRQAQAKALGIPANQTADDLKKAISEADNG